MKRKSLKDLTLLNRFLFAETMEDPEAMQIILETILGQEIPLKRVPQTEKEQKRSPQFRHIRLDVWAQDEADRVYDTEVQVRNTGNLPKRSRFYQSLIDGRLLEPGIVDFNVLNDVMIILIGPFDLFGAGRYRYTLRMACEEEPGLWLYDGAVRIFLNTHGKDPEHIRPELAELLYYMEHTNEVSEEEIESLNVRKLREKVEAIKANEEVGVRYMQEWEERELEKIDARNEGRKELLKELIQKKLAKNQTVEKIAEDLEEDFETVQRFVEEMKKQ